ncbi:MAG: FAD-dependent monooxygenase, partial [Burkholderiales bacterium]
MSRQAIIAGGGIAGLAAGAALAQRGWRVRIFERSPELRTFGAGIYIWDNGLRILESIGAYDEAVRGQVPAWRREARDAKNQVFRCNYVQGSRLFTIVRRDLLVALLNAAKRSGCDIEFGAEIQGAAA